MSEIDPDLGPFATLYEEWVLADSRDAEIEARLAATYRDVWATEDPMEQLYVLYFVYDRRNEGDGDLLLEGLKSKDRRVAEHAAPTALVWMKKYHLMAESPELIEAFRVFSLQNPGSDVVRPLSLRCADGWPEGRPFVQLYERWMCDDYPRDAAIEARLVEMHVAAWEQGDPVDRAFVLNFLSMRRYLDSVELICEGLKSDDARLARAASFHAWCAIADGVDLGPDIREILEDHRERFPQRGGTAWNALCALDEDIRVPSVPRSYQV